ncbi:hypothetical protein BCV71DRAFT_255252 [Rhizopus microsporus]|uniref:Uncharacterized protein n=1 Tax=Rhizopus microsporus TaxID=58291 RepID=A0A1X0S3G9_RHIZD|nr:hypothetical protein BCV71DRAFT_255252 [Rhizopus microsporus]
MSRRLVTFSCRFLAVIVKYNKNKLTASNNTINENILFSSTNTCHLKMLCLQFKKEHNVNLYEKQMGLALPLRMNSKKLSTILILVLCLIVITMPMFLHYVIVQTYALSAMIKTVANKFAYVSVETFQKLKLYFVHISAFEELMCRYLTVELFSLQIGSSKDVLILGHHVVFVLLSFGPE